MLVLKEFKLDANAETFLHIKGREQGVIAWMLSKIGLDPITELKCDRRELMFKTSSPKKGQLNISIPLTAVTAVVTGYHKPFALLVIAAILLLGTIPALFTEPVMAILTLLIGGVFALLYVLSKSMLFGVYNGGDKPIAAFQAKRSVIEGVSVDFDKFEKAAAHLNKAVLDCQTVAAAATGQSAVKPSAPATDASM